MPEKFFERKNGNQLLVSGVALSCIRSTPRGADVVSAAERVFGTPLCLPGDFLDTPVPSANLFMTKLKL